MQTIRTELSGRIDFFRDQGRLLEAQRIEERTHFDLEMIQGAGYCNGIENYSRHLTGRRPGEPPPTLLDYFPKDFLLFIDESHIAVPQLQGMYRGDRSRKETLWSMASGCLRPGQPTADVRGVPVALQPGGLCFRHPGELRDANGR